MSHRSAQAQAQAQVQAQARQSATKGFAKTQKHFVAKNQDHNHNPASKDPNPRATLSSSLRQSLSCSSDGAAIGGSFVNYLPQDEAVAAGLGADEGGLDPVESQRVVDLLNRELSRLLKLSPKEFWREVASDTSLHEFLDSFLQFRSRWYDFPHRGAKEKVAGVIVGELELSRRVFMVLYRISSNRDPGARAANSLSPKDHGVLLQEKLLLDLPKLLDICAIFGHENEDLTRVLVRNALSAQPWIHDNLISVISHFLSIVHTMQQRCNSSLEALFSFGSHGEYGSNRLYADMLEVMDFINDAIVSMDALISAYKPVAAFFSFPVEIRDGNDELLCTLAKLHDSLIPSLQRGFHIMLSSREVANVSDIHTGLSLLAMRIIKFGYNLLDLCYLSDEAFREDIPIPAATKMFPANIEDPFIRADILVQTFREISAVSISTQENQSRHTLLQNIEKNFHLMSKLENLQNTGWIFLDDEQLEYVSGIFMHSKNAKIKDLPSTQHLPATINKLETDEDAVIVESKVSQIKELFPDYGKGFLAACLEAYNQNPEEVIQRILEGTLHEDLQSLDTSLETMPTSKTAVTVSKNDKGKGKLVESAPVVSSNIVAGKSVHQNAGPSASSVSSSSSVGRFVRKAKEDGPDSDTLDARNKKDSARTAALVSQYEYEDEYDDSFDDLGLSVAESGLEDNEILGDKISSNRGKSWERGEKEVETSYQNPSDSSRWGSRKKPQYYVKDGKNYSYKVEGSVAVANASEASLVTQAQEELIHGLGRGGNLPLGAVRQLMEANEDGEKLQDPSETEGRRFSGRGRGRRGGSRPRESNEQDKKTGVSEGEARDSTGGNNRGRGRRGGAPPRDSSGDQDKQIGASEGEGRENSGGNHRGRGRRGGNNYRKDRASAKHFAGLGGF